jgi:acyl-CoA synthetase (AMP-forming)/AMP-acid ligase II
MSRATLADILDQHARDRADGLALIDDDVELTWGQVAARVNRLAAALAEAGVGPGDRILWLAQNSFRVYELLFAAAQLGAMICPANWRWSAAEMAEMIGDFDPSVVFWQRTEIGATVDEARRAAGSAALWLQHDSTQGPDNYEQFLHGGAEAGPHRHGSADDALLVIYTAAIDGRPGGSMLSHHNLLSMARTTAWAYSVGPQTVFLNSGPMFHIGNFQIVGVPALVMGGTNVVLRRTDAQEVLGTLASRHCTSAFLMPATIAEVVALQRVQQRDLSSFRPSSAAFLWAEVARVDDVPATRTSGGMGYGQTELTGMNVLPAFRGDSVGNAGQAAPGLAVRILDADGVEVPVGQAGEICARGDHVHLGYWNRPELNKQRFSGGWWHTTDLGCREADGSITFIGTMTRMIKSGAENIFPAEVEKAIESHPAVREAAVIGVPNPRFLQDVKAIVALQPGAAIGADEVIEHCRSCIASYKKPKSVEFVKALPRVGPIKDYAALDAAFGGGGYPGGLNLGGGADHAKTAAKG